MPDLLEQKRPGKEYCKNGLARVDCLQTVKASGRITALIGCIAAY